MEVCDRVKGAVQVLLHGTPARGESTLPGLVAEPNAIEDYQRHLIDMHDFDEDDDALEPWCDACGERIEVPGQDCMVDEGPCIPDVMDLAAMHADVHDDNECYPAHEHNY